MDSVIKRLGTVSYEIYIVQGAVGVFLVHYLYDYGILYFFATVLVTLFMAYVTKWFCDVTNKVIDEKYLFDHS